MSELADGEWHRPLAITPLLRGGIALIAIAGILFANLRERVLGLVVGDPRGYSGDPVDLVIDNGWLPIALAAAIGVIALVVALFYVAWRMHSFRVTDELVEVRSGVLFRTHRKARLDRIQAIDVVRPLFARLFGAARLDVQVAGQDGTVRLEYLGGRAADALRADILRLASGARAADAAARSGAAPAGTAPGVAVPGGGSATDAASSTVGPGGGAEGAASGLGYPVEHPEQRLSPLPAAGATAASGPRLVETRLNEFLAPELDPALPVTGSVLRMDVGRLIGSTILSPTTFWFVVVAVAVVVGAVATGAEWIVFAYVPAVLGLGSVLVRRVTKFLRYSIAATPDGVRVGYGLLSTSNETLPPGRIHAISVSQPISWRPFGWWQVRVNRAAQTRNNNQAQQESTVLPVGTRDEVVRVLALLVDGLGADDVRAVLDSGLATGGDWTVSPRRAAVLRWFSWRRNGFALTRETALLRRGAIWRELVVVPFARMQSVALHQGPLLRALRLAEVQLHTVAGPISGRLGALDAGDASELFRVTARDAVAAAGADRTHRWGSGR